MTNLIVAALIGLPLYVAYSLVRPTKNCRRCGGWGSKPRRGADVAAAPVPPVRRHRGAVPGARPARVRGPRRDAPPRRADRAGCGPHRGARAGEVMSCPGLHCPGCSGGQSLGIAAAVVVGLASPPRWCSG